LHDVLPFSVCYRTPKKSGGGLSSLCMVNTGSGAGSAIAEEAHLSIKAVYNDSKTGNGRDVMKFIILDTLNLSK